MARLSRWLRRAVRLARRDAVERSMDAEFRHHLDCEVAERVARGMPPDEARRTALRDFGGIESMKEQGRDARGGRGLEDAVRDIRYAIRVLGRDPAYTAGAVLTFALGVGAVTAIVSLVYGILLRPLPYAAPDRLVVVWERHVQRNRDRNVVSLDNLEAWRDRAQGFERMAAIVPTSVTLHADPAPERLLGAEVTPGYFEVLGVAPAIGRHFTASDAHDGLAALLSDALWRRRFDANPAVVGRRVTMSGKAYTVVGVMPRGFDPPRLGWLGEQELWFPLVTTPQSRAWGRFLIVLARLAPAVSIDGAQAEMAAIARQLSDAPGNEGWSASVRPLQSEITGDVRSPLLVLLAAVALLLLLAVANVATLTLSALARRTGELAVRRAIGATDQRLFRQLFTQSAVVGVIGAAAGVLVAVPAVRLLVALLPPDMPRSESVAIDGPVLLVTTALSVAATIGFGSFAAVRGRRRDSTVALICDAGARTPARTAASGALVVVEVALAVALGVMAVLMARSFAGLRAVDLGFEPAGAVVARVALPGTYDSPAGQKQFFEDLVARVRRLPGVRAAGIVSARPFGGIGPATTIRDAAWPAASGGEDPIADIRHADPGAFAALGIRLTRGSTFDASDTDGQAGVVISETLARAVWPDRDPIGRTLGLSLHDGLRATVIGVVDDVHLTDARTPPRPVAYLSAARFPDRVRDLVVRVEGDPTAIAPTLRAEVASMDASLPLYSVTTMGTLVDRSFARDRLTAFLLAAFATVALLLASVGVFGVVAGDVANRRKEIGIRLALGSRPSAVLALLLRRASVRIFVGVAGGVAIALAGGRVMRSLLFGVTPADPVSFLSIAVLMSAIAATATVLPGVQALRRSPLSTLREG
jgi:predicted permease